MTKFAILQVYSLQFLYKSTHWTGGRHER